jgi:aryl-alcohol dehydrogenase-like predicted oxidoreductase
MNPTFVLGGELEVRRLGFGAMRVVKDREEGARVVRRAVELGATLIDTADVYGAGVSEEVVAEALHPYPEGVVIATKGGLGYGLQDRIRDGRPEHLREACDASLRRLRLDRIDLYYLHRHDPEVPVEESVGALEQLRQEGKIRLIGVSNFSLSQLRQAQSVTKIAAVQNEYNRGLLISEVVLDACEAEGIGFVPWSPLGAGFLTGKIDASTPIAATDFRAASPRFTPEAREHNLALVELVSKVADRRRATPAQVALAWLLAQRPWIVPIPGTTKLHRLEENLGAANVQLTSDDLRELDGSSRIEIQGERLPEAILAMSETE